jgi:hypothetical protein
MKGLSKTREMMNVNYEGENGQMRIYKNEVKQNIHRTYTKSVPQVVSPKRKTDWTH